MYLSTEALQSEQNRIITALQHRLDKHEPWTVALIDDATTLRGIIRELQAREDDQQ